LEPDVICLQETKTKEQPIAVEGYHHYSVISAKDRYCGCMALTREEPKDVLFGMGIPEFDVEARVITVDMGEFYIVNTYAPNTVDKLERGIFRLEWSDAYREFVAKLMEKKPVVLCGDYNVSLSSLDYYTENTRKIKSEDTGFESDERVAVEELLELGLTDAFRYLYPDTVSFTQWPNKNGAENRRQNRGARLDYFFLSDALLPRVRDVVHYREIIGSDHCPIGLELGEVKM
jgi:exodeoxyribonuclease-3